MDREVLDPLQVVMLGLRRELPDRHVFDHAPAYGLIAWSVMGRLLSGGRVATPHLQTGHASYLSPPRAFGGGALPRERFSAVARNGHGAMSDMSPLWKAERKTSAPDEYFAF